MALGRRPTVSMRGERQRRVCLCAATAAAIPTTTAADTAATTNCLVRQLIANIAITAAAGKGFSGSMRYYYEFPSPGERSPTGATGNVPVPPLGEPSPRGTNIPLGNAGSPRGKSPENAMFPCEKQRSPGEKKTRSPGELESKKSPGERSPRMR